MEVCRSSPLVVNFTVRLTKNVKITQDCFCDEIATDRYTNTWWSWWLSSGKYFATVTHTLEIFLRDFDQYWHESRVAEDFISKPWCESLVSPHLKAALVTAEAIWIQCSHCHVQDSSLRWLIILLKAAVVRKSWTWSATRLSELFVLKGPKCANKIPHTTLHHNQPEPLIRGRLDWGCHVVYAKVWQS